MPVRPEYELIFRHATIVDGSGAPPVEGDVAVRAGDVARVGGKVAGRGVEEVDARGPVSYTHLDVYKRQMQHNDRQPPS